jgi:hypothetical protein
LYDAGTFLRHRNSGSLVEIWNNGALISTIAWNGEWKLTGSVVENVSLTHATTAPVCYDATSRMLYFSSGISGNYTPRFALDSAGNLQIAGTLQESVVRSDLLLSDCMAATAAYFAKCVSDMVPVLVFDVGLRCLQVRGTIQESAWLA